jgi:Ser/Thr protein kinase RdoA (MazF antagonist)
LNHITQVERAIKNISVPLTPCHRDLNPRNIIVNENHLKIIDWGCGALANPFFDIAHFFIMNNITPAQQDLFLTAYNPSYLQPQWRTYLNHIKKVTLQVIGLCLLLHVQNSNAALIDHEKITADHDLHFYVHKFASEPDKDTDHMFYNFGLALINASLGKMR